MSALQPLRTLAPSTASAIESANALQRHDLQRAQVPVTTHHVLHGGQYHRTICIPAGVRLVGALIRVPTTVVLCGCALVLAGNGDEVELDGYHVLPASADRKQVFLALADTFITMSFATRATTLEEVEAELTTEADLLFSRRGENQVVITGE